MVGRLIDVFPSANEVLAISAEEGELAKTSIPEYLDEVISIERVRKSIAESPRSKLSRIGSKGETAPKSLSVIRDV